MTPYSDEDLAALAAFDTPTICNALERLDRATQGSGYTTRPFVCGDAAMKPIVGYARTATIRTTRPAEPDLKSQRALRDDYYRHIEAGPRPAIVVIEDLDGDESPGAFWGEVQSAIHAGLGMLGLVTNGSVRDLEQWAPGFAFLAGRVTASHAFVRPVALGVDVNVLGMKVKNGDLLHADRHGAVVVPAAHVRGIARAAREVAEREARILEVARSPDCTAQRLIEVFSRLDHTH